MKRLVLVAKTLLQLMTCVALSAAITFNVAGCKSNATTDEVTLMEEAKRRTTQIPHFTASASNLLSQLHRAVTEEELRRWALPFLEQARGITKPQRVPKPEWPAFVMSLKKPVSPTVIGIYPPTKHKELYINIAWLSGRGSEGIVIGDKGFEPGEGFGYALRFAAGVYVWSRPL